MKNSDKEPSVEPHPIDRLVSMISAENSDIALALNRLPPSIKEVFDVEEITKKQVKEYHLEWANWHRAYIKTLDQYYYDEEDNKIHESEAKLHEILAKSIEA